MTDPVSGRQFELRAHGYEASIASVGATLRRLRDSRGDLVLPFPHDIMRPAMRGALLAPWPNRTADGSYEFSGTRHQLPINEPEFHNAAHGLAAWLDFTEVERTESRVTLTAVIAAQPGYPWRVRLDVTYEVTSLGLEQRIVAHNESPAPAPFAIGGHPYLVAGPASPNAADGWSLLVPADLIMEVSADRLLPIGILPVDHDGGERDFRMPRPVGPTKINNAFTGLQRGPDGTAGVRVVDRRGLGVELLFGTSCPWVQIYVPEIDGTSDHRNAIAVEPMTAPPDALNSKRDLMVIEPGESVTASWSIRRVDPAH